MTSTTVGKILVDSQLPEDLREHGVLDKKGLSALLSDVARKYPTRYREISKNLADIGWRAAQETGGFSFGMQHLRKSPYAAAAQAQMKQRIAGILADDRLSDEQRDAAIIKLVGPRMKELQDKVYEEADREGNPLAMQLKGAGRGNKMSLASLLSGDMLYSDHHDKVIPVPVFSSYSEGLKPWEAWSGSYGARKGVLATKFATSDAGFFGKQLAQIAHRLVVTDLDDHRPHDATAPRGLPVDASDMDNEGSLLAQDIGPYSRNTVLTSKILKHVQQLGHKKILVRSPLVGGSPEGGVYARDVGVREHGDLPGRGTNAGMTAVQALSEGVSQGMLSMKHSGGVAGEGKSLSGFDYINSLVQVPKHMEGGATHADTSGIVSRIEDNPAGGLFVSINGQKHFIHDTQKPLIKVGDRVEAGDVLSDGIPSPAKVVEHKGIGEGRRYFVKAFGDTMKQAGLKAHRRNIELLSRGLINHVRLTEEMGDYVPEDVVPYSTLEHIYRPREGAKFDKPNNLAGHHLEKPVLHYTIGTQLTPNVLKELNDFGVQKVAAHPDPPPFKPEMIRGMGNLGVDPDWMTNQFGSGLKKSLLHGVQRGTTSDEAGTSFVPSLARGVDFGRKGLVHAPESGWGVNEATGQTFKKAAESSFLPSGPSFNPTTAAPKPAPVAKPSVAPAPAAPAASAPAPQPAGGNPYIKAPPQQPVQPAQQSGFHPENDPTWLQNIMPAVMPMLSGLPQPLGGMAAMTMLSPSAMGTLTGMWGQNGRQAPEAETAAAPAAEAKPSWPEQVVDHVGNTAERVADTVGAASGSASTPSTESPPKTWSEQAHENAWYPFGQPGAGDSIAKVLGKELTSIDVPQGTDKPGYGIPQTLIGQQNNLTKGDLWSRIARLGTWGGSKTLQGVGKGLSAAGNVGEQSVWWPKAFRGIGEALTGGGTGLGWVDKGLGAVGHAFNAASPLFMSYDPHDPLVNANNGFIALTSQAQAALPEVQRAQAAARAAAAAAKAAPTVAGGGQAAEAAAAESMLARTAPEVLAAGGAKAPWWRLAGLGSAAARYNPLIWAVMAGAKSYIDAMETGKARGYQGWHEQLNQGFLDNSDAFIKDQANMVANPSLWNSVKQLAAPVVHPMEILGMSGAYARSRDDLNREVPAAANAEQNLQNRVQQGVQQRNAAARGTAFGNAYEHVMMEIMPDGTERPAAIRLSGSTDSGQAFPHLVPRVRDKVSGRIVDTTQLPLWAQVAAKLPGQVQPGMTPAQLQALCEQFGQATPGMLDAAMAAQPQQQTPQEIVQPLLKSTQN